MALQASVDIMTMASRRAKKLRGYRSLLIELDERLALAEQVSIDKEK